MRTIIVTGATGFIGKYVVNKLLEQGICVLGISRTGQDTFHELYVPVKANIDSRTDVERIFASYKNIDGIIHLAANIDMLGNEEVIQTNCLGTYHLACCAVENDLKFLINISSIPVIGVPRDLPITESHLEQPRTLYHVSKLAGEQIINVVCSHKLRVINMRISSPIGCGMNSKNFLSIILNKCIHNEDIEVYGKGTRVQNYIDVRDVANAIEKAIQVQESGLYLVAGEKGISNLDLARLCKSITNSQSNIIFGRREDAEESNRWVISIEKAKKELGFDPIYQLNDTISWIVDSMRI